MRKIIWMMSVSVDGFIEGPNRELGWQMVNEELHNHFNEAISKMGVALEGRVMHELMARVWPTADTDPASLLQAGERGLLRPTVEFARIWRDIPKMVSSRTLQRADWNATILRDVVPQEIQKLKAQPGGDLLLGGADLAAAFLRHDLIDEFRIYVHPVVIGQGKPLSPSGGAQLKFRLGGTRAFSNGVVLLRYQRADLETQ